MQKNDQNIGFQENRQLFRRKMGETANYFAEKWGKPPIISQKIGENRRKLLL
jgi:hypothetical protein